MVFSAAGIVTNNCGGALVGFGSYCYGRYIYDIGVRSVVTKVPVEEIPKMAKENWLESRKRVLYKDLPCMMLSLIYVLKMPLVFTG